ncbi:MAG TPA: helix-turn-helix domain-containing protein, partial [bacterium]|nr:helix-turn-helix domain-containing protein [bacterium]
MNEKKLGDILREKRESLNLTVKELASTTKLKKSVILALENGDYGELQESVYIRGFFKIYASALGLDYKELYPQLEKELRAIGKIPEEEGKPGRKSVIFIVIIAIIIAVPVLYYIISSSSPGVKEPESNVEITQPVTE